MDLLNLIETRISNLHNTLKNELLLRLSALYPCKKYILYSEINSFKKEKNIIAVGKFTRRYWQTRGWPEDKITELTNSHARNKTNLSSPMTIDHWLTKINPSTDLLYTLEQAKFKIRSHRKMNIEYWQTKGFSNDEAILKISEYQKENGNKFSDKNKKSPEKYSDRTWTQINYWIKKGYSIDESIQIISEKQDKVSLSSFINRYGEEGRLKYKSFIDSVKYSNSINYYIDKFGENEGPLIYKKYTLSKAPKHTSKESLKFFIPLYKQLRSLGFNTSDIFWGISGSKEYYLYDDSINSVFFYDFCIPKIKKILEYHGTSFHPNPSWEKEKLDSWKCTFLNISADEKLKIDQYKEDYARSKGYEVLCIWSDDKPSYETIINFLIK
jgi:hypothetical protein